DLLRRSGVVRELHGAPLVPDAEEHVCPSDGALHHADVFYRHVECLGDLFPTRGATKGLGESTLGLGQTEDQLATISGGGGAHQTTIADGKASDVRTHPERRIGGEAIAALHVEAARSLEQPQYRLAHQVVG